MYMEILATFCLWGMIGLLVWLSYIRGGWSLRTPAELTLMALCGPIVWVGSITIYLRHLRKL